MDTTQAEMPSAGKEKGGNPSESLENGGRAENAEQETISIQTVQVATQQLTQRALQFFSTASNEMIGACLVGLGAVTYFILGRVGLVLIGIVGGIALHAGWEGTGVNGTNQEVRAAEERRRKQVGLDVIHRVLDWRSRAVDATDGDGGSRADHELNLEAGKQLDYSGFRPETAAALNELTDAVIRDYVKWWYSPILPSEMVFPAVCRKTLVAFILSISAHLSRKRPADTFLDFLTHSSSIVIVFLDELSTALAASPTVSAPEAILTYLEVKLTSNLANILDTQNQQKKLDLVAEDILQSYLDPKTYNCEPARVFLREILAKVVLEMTIQSCSKPEWINDWIVYLLEEREAEPLHAIDAGVERATPDSLKNTADHGPEQQEVSASSHPASPAGDPNHRRVVSRAQEAMDEAMQEAQRLTQLIAEEDARRLREQHASELTPAGARPEMTTSPSHGSLEQAEKLGSPLRSGMSASSVNVHDDTSESTTHGITTPTSSQSDLAGDGDPTSFRDMSMDSVRDPSESSAPVHLVTPKSTFTSFDQILPLQPRTALTDSPEKAKRETIPLTLHKANISIFDDAMPGDRSAIRTKPTAEYLIQIEPAASHHPGWMIARRYVDFETLHEVLRRISVIAGVRFTEAHSTLPNWKGHTKTSLRGELERYLNDAVRFRQLAESEGMKRFLEKEQGLTQSPNASNKGFPGIGWPTPSAFESMGKGMIDVLTKAPKEVAGGGKALLGGVTGVLGGIAPKKAGSSPSNLSRTSTASSATNHSRRDNNNIPSMPEAARKSQDSVRTVSTSDTQPPSMPQMEARPSWNPNFETELKPRPSSSSRSPTHARSSPQNSKPPSVRESMELSSAYGGDQTISLPPLPTNIPDDYGPNTSAAALNQSRQSQASDRLLRAYPPVDINPTMPNATASDLTKDATRTTTAPETPAPQPSKSKPPLTAQETQVAIELIFAMINELYTLSSAWTLRRTLLTAAKTFLLRPGNPQLESIRQLLQSTLIDANTSDAGLAAHLRTLRANALPTEAELKAWPPPLSEAEKERLRVKARRLLVERGVPQALASVMGSAASGEAVGKVFDCLQVERVARGLVFGLLLQGVRAVAQ